MAFDLQELTDRVAVMIGREQSEEEKGFFADEMVVLFNEACQDLAREIAGSVDSAQPGVPGLRHTLEAGFRLTIAFGTVSLLDTATKTATDDTPTSLNFLTDSIRAVYYLPTVGSRQRCYPLRSTEEYDRPQPLGTIWYVKRETVIDTIDTTGKTRYTGNTLAGRLELIATFIPNITHFPNHEELQTMVVKHMAKYALAKRRDDLAAALVAATR